jgi:phosphate transport system protein
VATEVSEEVGRQVDRSLLEQGLADAERQAVAELELVRASLRNAVKVATSDVGRPSGKLIELAHESEQRYAELHDGLLALIARQAPVAGDLRLAMALLHVNDRVERMNAQCVNIATMRSAISNGGRPSARQLGCLAAMARLAGEQVGEAAQAFAQRDVDAALRLRDHDLAINDYNRRCFTHAIEDGKDEARREAAFFVALMARAVERIGDNAVDVGQQAIFVVTGRLRPGTGS